MITGLAHVCLAAGNLDDTQKFYCEGLGFTKAFDFVREGKAVGFYLEVSDRTYVEVFLQDSIRPDGACPIRHFCLEVQDIDAVAAHLKAKGYDVTEKKMGADQSWQAWTTDPAGIRIEFHQYTDQSCQTTGQTCVLD
jgi:catechol 2,3-dioxygenase-like lactoylglutathione lyase family enzyme